MIKNKLLLLSIFSLSLVLTGCPPTETDIILGEEFSLRFDGEMSIEPEALSLAFPEVTEDSRCPEDVQCIWAGRVRVRLLMDGATSITLSLTDNEHIVEYNGFKITLLDVLPYPNTSNNNSEKDYIITLVVDAL